MQLPIARGADIALDGENLVARVETTTGTIRRPNLQRLLDVTCVAGIIDRGSTAVEDSSHPTVQTLNGIVVATQRAWVGARDVRYRTPYVEADPTSRAMRLGGYVAIDPTDTQAAAERLLQAGVSGPGPDTVDVMLFGRSTIEGTLAALSEIGTPAAMRVRNIASLAVTKAGQGLPRI